MVHETVRYSRLAHDAPERATERSGEEEEEEEEEEEREDEEGEVTVYLRQAGYRMNGKAVKKDSWVRVVVALVLLGIVIGCILFQQNGWWSDPEGVHSDSNMDIKMEEEEGHEHEDGDGHHGHHSHDGHSHGHVPLYHHGVVLTSSANCSKVGKELLQEGGNVVDAAIASLLCLGVVHPHTAGVGGVFSAVLYNHSTGSFKSARSTAPHLPFASYGVPSILQGVKALHSQFGHAEWGRLFRDAIVLARKGFFIDDVLGRALESHENKILQSQLCDVFCDMSGRMKLAGVLATNRNLSELLRAASLNESHFPETLAIKLAEDLSAREGPAFKAALQRSHGEINESLITQGEKYTVLSASSPFAGLMLSKILGRVREQSLSFQSVAGDFNRTAAAITSLLNLTQGLNNAARAEKNLDLMELFALNSRSSHIGVLDRQGNFIVISASLNDTWGSGQFLPSSGIMLSSFTSEMSDLPYSNFPLVLTINSHDSQNEGDDENDDEENEAVVIATTGGLSAIFNAAILLQRVDFGMSFLDAISSPLIHLEPESSTACLSSISDNSDVYRLLPETDGHLEEVVECTEGSLSMLLQLHAEHVSAFGAPATKAHADGY